MSKTFASIASGFARLISMPQTEFRRMGTRLLTADALRLVYELQTKYGPIKFDVPNLRTLHTPWEFHRKEPPTVAWVDRIAIDSVYWDIGANAGEFALYAAKRGIASVVAFEPSPATYANICRSRELNGFDNMRIFCLGLSDKVGVADFHMVSTDAGHSCHNIDPAYGGHAYVESILTMTVDSAIATFGLAAPEYVKVDIDGGEEKLIEGASGTLASGKIKSLYIELEEDQARFERISSRLAELGFRTKEVYRPEHLHYFFAEYEFAPQSSSVAED